MGFHFIKTVMEQNGALQTINGSRYGDSPLFKLYFKGVALLSLEIEFIEFSRYLHWDDVLASHGLHTDTDDLAVIGCPAEFFIDLALYEVFVPTEAISIFQEILDCERRYIREGSGLRRHEIFAHENHCDHCKDDPDNESGVGAGACATGHGFLGCECWKISDL